MPHCCRLNPFKLTHHFISIVFVLAAQECESKIAQEIASLSKEDVSKEEMTENEEEVINLLLAQVSHSKTQFKCSYELKRVESETPIPSVLRKMRSWPSRRSWSLWSRCYGDRLLPRRRRLRDFAQRSQTYRGEIRLKLRFSQCTCGWLPQL